MKDLLIKARVVVSGGYAFYRIPALNKRVCRDGPGVCEFRAWSYKEVYASL